MVKLILILFALSGQYLLMEPIQLSLSTGDFSHLKEISASKISVNFEPPFQLNGYFSIDKFVEDFNPAYNHYKIENIEWSSKQVEENFAVQSLNVKLVDYRSEQIVYYKFIFFLKKDKEWKIFYLKGLRL